MILYKMDDVDCFRDRLCYNTPRMTKTAVGCFVQPATIYALSGISSNRSSGKTVPRID